ncbi:MAG TPA: ribonucleotide-diphosphate reductase subunit beta [Actinomycetota bacterium]|nr:ribonucleotide-diphosphate reductase subunit beta [Actinomycetota bacterium]
MDVSNEVISPERLYGLWEQHNWSANSIDFTPDAGHWRERFDDRQRESVLWISSMFLVGEEAVARTLTPVMDASPELSDQIFLATQIVDEARHHVFFDRFLREVASVGSDTTTTLRKAESHLTWGFRQVFGELDRVTDELRRKPRDRALLAQTVSLYHLVVEGLLAVPGQHFLRESMKRMDVMPGFRQGVQHVANDESRHVAYGVLLLGRLVRSSPECRAAAIEMWDRVLGWAAGVFAPPGMDEAYPRALGFGVPEVFAFGMRSFETKVRRAGIDPSDIPMLSRLESDLSYEERATRAWELVRCGVIGTDAEPSPTPEVLRMIFEIMADEAQPDVLRRIGGTVEWRFSDGPAWHVRANDGHVEAVDAPADSPALVIRTTVPEWTKVAVQRTDPLRSVVGGRMRIDGPLSAKLKLSKLFGRPLVGAGRRKR